MHLSSIVKILEKEGDPGIGKAYSSQGAFAGLKAPQKTAKASAVYIARYLINTYLITHPHLDHIAGFVINTAALPGNSKKTQLAGLPSTIDAFKNHIFNNIIWPNLTDENDGVGLITYLRLVEGGSDEMGKGDSLGYMEVCDGLLVKTLGISHGKECKNPSQRPATPLTSAQRVSRSHRHSSISAQADPFEAPLDPQSCAVDSSVYFIRDQDTGHEILIFGDVEPDSVSLLPRNERVWIEAAPKIAQGRLKAIFIECSYDDSQGDLHLYGHLVPRHLSAELRNLAEKVEAVRSGVLSAERMDASVAISRPTYANHALNGPRRTSSKGMLSPTQPVLEESGTVMYHNAIAATSRIKVEGALKGIKIVVIHVKDTLSDDDRVNENIMEQLLEVERETKLGCEFEISSSGQSFYL